MRLRSRAMAEYYLEVLDRYVRIHQVTQYELIDVVRWGLANGEFDVSPRDKEQLALMRLREACRSDVIEYAPGRKARVKACVTVRDEDGQRTLWGTAVDMSKDYLTQSLRERARAIGADVYRWEEDKAYYNTLLAERGTRPIQMLLSDFIGDSAEDLAQAGD